MSDGVGQFGIRHTSDNGEHAKRPKSAMCGIRSALTRMLGGGEVMGSTTGEGTGRANIDVHGWRSSGRRRTRIWGYFPDAGVGNAPEFVVAVASGEWRNE
jgi:hypothetical protein